MSTDEEERRRLVAAANRIGHSLAERHASVIDAAIAALVALPRHPNNALQVEGAIAVWSIYLRYIVAHISGVLGLSQHEIAQQLIESILAQGESGRVN